SCGDGGILLEIVRRYVVAGFNSKQNLDEIKKGLEKNIFGYEIEKEKLNNCRKNLDDLVLNEYGIKNVNWNLFCRDYLKIKHENEFDFVIGNPPYISYRDLNLEEREYIRENYETCIQGKFDIYYAFLEAGIKSMNDNGKMVYLVPSNMFKCTFGRLIREFLKPHLTEIYDYKTEKIFSDKLTNSVILSLSKNKNLEHINYYDLSQKLSFEIPAYDLKDKWIFTQSTSENSSKEISYARFGDYFNAQVTIATLLNRAFILKDFEEFEDFIVENSSTLKIEKQLVRKAVNPRSFNLSREERIIFPYYYENGEFLRYSPEEFQKNFPFAKEYLSRFRSELDRRNSHANINWFEYGRSQALKKLNEPKILISILITKEVSTHILDEHTIPSSGIFITKTSKYSLKLAQKVLHSEEFMDYVKNIGIICNGRSYKITPSDINEFMFDKKNLYGGYNE
ncbi:MAG: N-6 DNA methylase, partial [Defluviitaleaceae bacterium]|nr:N-6 DNA methylase [Defluviitaleaceae bacterium]